MIYFWATSESSSDVSQEFFSNREKVGAINALSDSLNDQLSAIDGGEWQKWRVIFMIASAEHQAAFNMRETHRLTRKDMTLDFRVFADYEAAKTADFDKCIDLLVPPLERTLPFFSKAGIDKETQEKIRGFVRLAAEIAKAEKHQKH
jgi:hypothetical protein